MGQLSSGVLQRPIAAAGEVEPEEVAGLIDRVQREYEELQVSASLAIAYGQKPA